MNLSKIQVLIHHSPDLLQRSFSNPDHISILLPRTLVEITESSTICKSVTHSWAYIYTEFRALIHLHTPTHPPTPLKENKKDWWAFFEPKGRLVPHSLRFFKHSPKSYRVGYPKGSSRLVKSDAKMKHRLILMVLKTKLKKKCYTGS